MIPKRGTCSQHPKMAHSPVLESSCPGSVTASEVRGARRWQECQHLDYATRPSCTTSCCRWTPFALVCTAPGLLGHGPTCHPIGEAGIAIVWLRGSHASASLVWAAFPMDPATPLLLGYRPTCLPVRESILTVVWVGWARWLCRLTTDVVVIAAPSLLGRVPRHVLPDGAIVWVHWSRRCCGPDRGQSRRLRGRRRGRRSGRRSGEGRGRHCHCGSRQSCRRTTATHCGAAVIFLGLRPRVLDASQAGFAVIRWRRAGQQPTQQRDQQQETPTQADNTCEISPRPHHIEVPAASDVSVSGLLDVLSLASANIGQSTAPCSTATCDATGCAVFSRPNATSTPIASRATCCPCISTS